MEIKDNPIIKYENKTHAIMVFKLGSKNVVNSYLKDGVYQNLIDDSNIVVKDGKLELNSDPIIIKVGIEAIK